MPVQLPASRAGEVEELSGPWRVLAGIAIVGLGLFVAATVFLPQGLVLPVVGLAAVPAVMACATLAWLRGGQSRPNRITYWDVAGGVALVGIGASVLGDPMQIVSFFEARSN